MKQVVVGVLLGLLGASLACAQKEDDMKKKTSSTPTVTRDYLLANGFRESKEGRPGAFVHEHAHLGNVMRTIGVPLAALRPTVSQPNYSDVRTANSNGLYVLVRSEVRDKKGNIVSHSLDDPEALCAVEVWIEGPKRDYKKTDGPPRLQVKSVTPEDAGKSLQVMFEIAATGKKPVAIWWRTDLQFRLMGGNIPPGSELIGYSFPEKTPQKIIVSPGKPTAIQATVLVVESGQAPLSPGEYALRIRIGPLKRREPQRFDYEWEGREHWSNEYKFVVK
jgi:hypothetical protein